MLSLPLFTGLNLGLIAIALSLSCSGKTGYVQIMGSCSPTAYQKEQPVVSHDTTYHFKSAINDNIGK